MTVESRHSPVPGAPPPAPQGPVASLRRRLQRSRNGLWFIPAIFVLLGAAYLAQATEVFTTRQNMLNPAAQTTPILIVSIGQMLVVVIRGLDLSVGAVMSLTTALLVFDAPLEVTLPLVFGVAIAIGLANGVMAVLLNVHPIIATLATMSVVQGITLLVRPVAGGQVPRGIRDLASGTILGLPAPVVICAVVLLVAWVLGQLLVMSVRSIDLSVGGVILLVNYIISAGVLGGLPLPLVLALCLAMGMAVGVLNGILVAWRRASAVIVTLAVGLILTGIVEYMASGRPPGSVPMDLRALYNTRYFGVPGPVILWLVLSMVSAVALSRLVYGRYVTAVGENPVAARIAGVPVERTILMAHAISGADGRAGGGGAVMRMRLKAKGHTASPRTALDLLARIQKHTAHAGKRSFQGLSKNTPEQLDLFDALSLPKPA